MINGPLSTCSCPRAVSLVLSMHLEAACIQFQKQMNGAEFNLLIIAQLGGKAMIRWVRQTQMTLPVWLHYSHAHTEASWDCTIREVAPPPDNRVCKQHFSLYLCPGVGLMCTTFTAYILCQMLILIQNGCNPIYSHRVGIFRSVPPMVAPSSVIRWGICCVRGMPHC